MSLEKYQEFKKQLPSLREFESRWNRISNLSKQADAISQGADGGILTLSWSKEDSNRRVLRIKRGSSLERVFADVGAGIDYSKLNGLVSTSAITVIEGDLPDSPKWHRWLSTSCKACVLSSRHSPNNTPRSKALAALLGTNIPMPRGLIAYNALPYERSVLRSVKERTRMRIQGSRRDWEAISDRIGKSLSGDTSGQVKASITLETANKDSVLKELREGDSDVLLIFAHSDGTRIYMPGSTGSSISVDELRAIRRKAPPVRAVILIACEAGSVNRGTHSIAEALLNSNLAMTVFAYPGVINATYIPEMLGKLGSRESLRDSLPGLYQIVGVQGVDIESSHAIRLRLGFQFCPLDGTTSRRGNG